MTDPVIEGWSKFVGAPRQSLGGALDGATIYLPGVSVWNFDFDGVNHQIPLSATWGPDPSGYVVGDGTLAIPVGKAGYFRAWAAAFVRANSMATDATKLVFWQLDILTSPFTIGAAASIGPLHGSGVVVGGAVNPQWASPLAIPVSYLNVGDVIMLNVAGTPHGWTPSGGEGEVEQSVSLTFLTLERVGS